MHFLDKMVNPNFGSRSRHENFTMAIHHLFLVLIVVAIWGFNFVFVKFALHEITPLWLCAIRFFMASIPAIFFIKPPAAPFRMIALYGLLMFGLQFVLVFIGIQVGMTPGLASLLMQVQVFFSLFFAMVFLGEKPALWQIMGALIAFTGICVVASHLDNNITLLSFILIMGSAASWGLGNLVTKKLSHVNMIALVVWASFISFFPLLLLALIFDGTDSLIASYHNISALGVTSVLFIVYGSTWIGYGIWNKLLSRYSVAVVVPFSLLVPVFGMLSSVLLLDEPFQSWKLMAGMLVITGLFINTIGARFFIRNKLKADVAS